MSSLLLLSDDKRYHWMEHFETSRASAERGWTRIIEPKVSEPLNSYILNLFASAHLLIVSCKDEEEEYNNEINRKVTKTW